MARENVEEKGRRYLLEGRLTVTAVDERVVRASCRGGGAIYVVGFDGEAWGCSCPAVGRCAHLVALQLVTVREQREHDDPEPRVTRPATAAGGFEDDPEPDPGRVPVPFNEFPAGF